MVEALNKGTLFDRSSRVFEEAARTQRLYDVLVGEDQRIISAGMLQDTLKEADGPHPEEELGALMVHPAARAIGIVGLMIKLMLVHRYAVLRSSDAVEIATLGWVDWVNTRRLLEPIGHIPPAEAEDRYYAELATRHAAAQELKPTSLRKTRGGSSSFDAVMKRA